ncbi:MAG: hypothetical protein HQM03_08090 [Magnetococcales bacterium]|nr:hypothetical protein [Magnetococcales bacterium]
MTHAPPGERHSAFLLSIVIVLVGLCGRTIIEKALAMRGGTEAVALWGQVGSLVDLLSGVGLAGIGVGVTVLVAGEGRVGHRRGILYSGVAVGLLLSGLLLLVVERYPGFLVAMVDGLLPPDLLRLATLAGMLTIVPGVLTGYWQGLGRRRLLLGWAVLVVVLILVAVFWPGGTPLMERLLWAQIVPALAVAGVFCYRFMRHFHDIDWQETWRPLLRFAPVGISIGLLSPFSSLLMRSRLAELLSWHDVGMIQAQWRIIEWVTALASGVMVYHYLPLLSAAEGEAFFRQLRRMALATLPPAALLMIFFILLQDIITQFFYQSGFALPLPAAMMFLLGDWIRVVAWVFLYALYARRQTVAITWGEFLSLPLFTALLWLVPGPLLPWQVGGLWVISYCAYAVFNGWMVVRKVS